MGNLAFRTPNMFIYLINPHCVQSVFFPLHLTMWIISYLNMSDFNILFMVNSLDLSYIPHFGCKTLLQVWRINNYTYCSQDTASELSCVGGRHLPHHEQILSPALWCSHVLKVFSPSSGFDFLQVIDVTAVHYFPQCVCHLCYTWAVAKYVGVMTIPHSNTVLPIQISDTSYQANCTISYPFHGGPSYISWVWLLSGWPQEWPPQPLSFYNPYQTMYDLLTPLSSYIP